MTFQQTDTILATYDVLFFLLCVGICLLNKHKRYCLYTL